MVTIEIVITFVDTRESTNPHTIHLHHPSVAQEEYVGSNPASVGQLLQVVGGLVVASNEDGEDRSDGLAAVVFVETAHGLVLVWTGHAGEVGEVSGGLEVSAAQQQVHLDSISVL